MIDKIIGDGATDLFKAGLSRALTLNRALNDLAEVVIVTLPC